MTEPVTYWQSTEVRMADACSDCGGHPELCDCDGIDLMGDDDD